jgi:2-amino-4-hydroxy-6-hydroxymethyldihydropteridine diphosphokinase
MTQKLALIALGSNLGDSRRNLQTAVSAMRVLAVSDIRVSSIWRTRPLGFETEVPDFLNAVVAFETETAPEHLLNALKQIEHLIGRGPRNGQAYESRPIDLDIVDLGGEVLVQPGLTLPHPRAKDRTFVLLPLQEVAPDFRFPGDDRPLETLIAGVQEQALERTSLSF